MGVNQSIQKKTHEIEQAIEQKINQRAMIQREIQMSVSIAQARDSLMWFGSLYSLLITGLSTAFLLKKPVSKLVGIPVTLGGFGLLNMYDFAYGSKITRVAKEAEHILNNERYRLIPPSNAPFSDLYEQERSANHPFKSSNAVGKYWPSFLPISRKSKE
jgi:predicted XRE-type DNA-binding protein